MDREPPPTAATTDASVPALSLAPPIQPPWSSQTLFLAAALLALLAAAATPLDLPLARWVKTTDLPRDLERFIRLCEFFGFGGTVAVVIIAAGILDPRGWLVVRRLIVTVLGAGLLSNAAKLLIARHRPYAADLDGTSLATFFTWFPLAHKADLPSKYGHAFQSFPSGHSATAVSLALALAYFYPRARWLFVTLAALACYQRIDANAHFLTDCLTGASIACATAALTQRLKTW